MLDIKKRENKAFIVYFLSAIVCYLIVQLYYQYSHNVTSIYLTYFYLTPLLSSFMFLILSKFNIKGRVSFNLFNASIWTLMSGFLVKGIVLIAGTTSDLIIMFFIISIIQFILSIIFINK